MIVPTARNDARTRYQMKEEIYLEAGCCWLNFPNQSFHDVSPIPITSNPRNVGDTLHIVFRASHHVNRLEEASYSGCIMADDAPMLWSSDILRRKA